jgi:hypothetical protein
MRREAMKVFITWSGEHSKVIAEGLRDFIPTIVQTVTCFLSGSDIEKGTNWQAKISQELDESDAGIICLTPDNLESRWIHFEAGAFSKKLQKADQHVYTYLHRVTAADVESPLSMFQHTVANKKDTLKLLKEIRLSSKSTISRG